MITQFWEDFRRKSNKNGIKKHCKIKQITINMIKIDFKKCHIPVRISRLLNLKQFYHYNSYYL